MEKLYRGKLTDHVQIVSRNIEASRRFYEAIFKVLNISVGGSGMEFFWADELFVSSRKYDPHSKIPGSPVHLTFKAEDPMMVNYFFKTGLSAGGADDGKPGERKYRKGFYAAFLRDPDGNFVEAVYHGPTRLAVSAEEIEWNIS